MNTRFVTKSAIIASIYVVLTVIFQAISFTKDQFRVSEILILLVILNYKYIIGLSVGTFIANMLLSPVGIIDAVFGTITSIIVMLLIIFISKNLKRFINKEKNNSYYDIFLYLISAIIAGVLNGIYVPILLIYSDSVQNTLEFFIPFFINVFLGEFSVVFFVGSAMMMSISKSRVLKEKIEEL